LALPSSKVKLFLFIPIFAIAIAKIGIRIKKLTALPERPIKVPFRGFRGLQKRFEKIKDRKKITKLFRLAPLNYVLDFFVKFN
jgi:hypothetical protein